MDSVCPYGWKLPTTTNFGVMLNAQGITSSTEGVLSITKEIPLSFNLNGVLDGVGRLGYIRGAGDYWTSMVTAPSSSYPDIPRANNLIFDFRPLILYTDTSNRVAAMSVRCLKRDDSNP